MRNGLLLVLLAKPIPPKKCSKLDGIVRAFEVEFETVEHGGLIVESCLGAFAHVVACGFLRVVPDDCACRRDDA